MASINAANLFAVTGLVAVVTGGGSGIGLMIAKALALNGAEKVYIIGRRKEVLESAAKTASQGNIIPIVGDVTSKDSLQSIVTQIEKETGFINVLIANCGTVGPQTPPISPTTSLKDFQSALWNLPSDEYTGVFALNVSAVHFTIVAFLHLLHAGNEKRNVEQKSQVIVTSSIGGFNRNVPGGYAYGQSKAAVTLLVKQMATQMVPYEIRANAIAPGIYPSEMATSYIEKFKGVISKAVIPAERVGSEEDMAGCILYMTSRGGAYINGTIMITDGGRLSVMPGTY